MGDVDVREEAALTAELTARLRSGSGRRALSVTELLLPRPAYWRRTSAPVPAPLARQARMNLGRAWHRAFEAVLAAEGPTEVRVRRDGVSARIDHLAGIPLEIKTGATPVGADLARERPEWVAQLALYCALVGGSEGRCAYLRLSAGGRPAVSAFEVRFRSYERLRALLGDSEARLRTALEGRDPTPLPRCAWFGRGCEFQTAGVCACRGSEPAESLEFGSEIETVAEAPELGARWTGALAPEPPAAERWARFRELLYPRRTYFEQRDEGPEPPGEAPGFGPPDLYDRLLEALEGGPPGEVASLPPQGTGPEEEVVGWRDHPYLLKVSRAWDRYAPAEIASRFPQYELELGFRCARAGRSNGLVIVGYERAERDDDRLQVLSFAFRERDRWGERWNERAEALDRALQDAAPLGLPACPRWMADSCPYAAVCGCAERETRSQR